MNADLVEVSWEAPKKKWLVRIKIGDEVIRRFCDVPQSAEETAIRSAVQKTVEDEGYQADAAKVTIRR
jgi:hypothetical protein